MEPHPRSKSSDLAHFIFAAALDRLGLTGLRQTDSTCNKWGLFDHSLRQPSGLESAGMEAARTSIVDGLLSACAIVASVAAMAAVDRYAAVSRQPPQYEAGMVFEDPDAPRGASASRTLIIWLDSSCGACTASMPFYRQLLARVRRTRIVVMGRESVASLSDYLSMYRVEPDRIVSMPNRAAKFRGTPTLMVVGPDSVIESVWYGRRQSAKEEEEVARMVD